MLAKVFYTAAPALFLLGISVVTRLDAGLATLVLGVLLTSSVAIQLVMTGLLIEQRERSL